MQCILELKVIVVCLFFCRKEVEFCIFNKFEYEVDEVEFDQFGYLIIDDIVILKKGEIEKVIILKGFGVIVVEENEEVLFLRI